jgi:hypothetical protein
MKKFLICLPLLTPFAANAAEPEVKLAGLQIVYDSAEKDYDGFKTYNTDPGHSVTLLVRSGDKEIVGFDDGKATVKIGGATAKCHFFGANMAFSKDHRTLRVEFSAEKPVQVAADGTLKITGELPITLATGKAETRSEAFSVAKGTAVKFPADKPGMPTLKVKSSGKSEWGDDPFEIVFTTNRKADEFAGIKFYTKDGKPVESNRTSSSWMGMGKSGSGDMTYTFKAAQTDLIFALESWTGSEEKKLKVDINATLAVPK